MCIVHTTSWKCQEVRVNLVGHFGQTCGVLCPVTNLYLSLGTDQLAQNTLIEQSFWFSSPLKIKYSLINFLLVLFSRFGDTSHRTCIVEETLVFSLIKPCTHFMVLDC